MNQTLAHQFFFSVKRKIDLKTKDSSFSVDNIPLTITANRKELTMSAEENDKCEIYKDVREEWRWIRTAPNGEVIGASTEGYKNKADCIANAERNMMVCPISETKRMVDRFVTL
jgi:uncharacterized protein YegP (UPF0339 family)